MATGTDVVLNSNLMPDVKQVICKKISTKMREDGDDPFAVCNISKVAERHKLWVQHFPNVKPFYAVKCNDDPTLLKCLANLGTGFDCASKVEIKTVLDLGVQPGDIVFANPCKQQSHVKYAAKKDVSLMTFDNEAELHKIAAHYPNAQLIIRIKADAEDALVRLGAKFGCSLSEAVYLLQVARHLRLDIVGVSFHVGSDCREPLAYRTAIDKAHQVFQYVEQEGYRLTLLDIGGGFTGNDSSNDLFAEVAKVVNSRIEQLFSDGYPELTVIAEPGRFFAASCLTLAVQVISKRQSADEDTMYYINDGVYGTFSGLMYENAVVQPHKLMESPNEECYPCSLWGPTCDSVDKVGSYFLPELFVGDWLLFYNMGAYSIASSSGFNGFSRPEIIYYTPKESLGHASQAPHLASIDGSSQELAVCS